MPEKVIWVDYENVHDVDLSLVPADAAVTVLFGSAQKSVSRKFFADARKLNDRYDDIEVEGTGPNALDFHLAFYLGATLEKAPTTECVILSKDKGFGVLVRHLRKRGFDVRQVDALDQVPVPPPDTENAPDPAYARIVANLQKVDKKARPGSRAKLRNHVATLLNGSARVGQVDRVVQKLITNGVVVEAGERLTYHEHRLGVTQ